MNFPTRIGNNRAAVVILTAAAWGLYGYVLWTATLGTLF